MRYKVSGAIAVSQASWRCAPALPNLIQCIFQESRIILQQFSADSRLIFTRICKDILIYQYHSTNKRKEFLHGNLVTSAGDL